ncbi:hypothetical protein PENTCL1PPCAC_28692, partial [Pristionchus entomophagus]
MHVVALPHVHMTSTGYWFLPRNDGIFRSKGGCMRSYIHHDWIFQRSIMVRQLGPFHWSLLSIVVYAANMGALFGVSLYTLVPNDYSRSVAPRFFIDLYGIDASDPDVGYLHITFKRPDANGELQWYGPTLFALTIAGIRIINNIMGLTIALGYLLISVSRTLQSGWKTKHLQRQLYKVLLIQTAVPFVFSYIPLTIMLFLPLTGIDLGSFGTVLVMVTTVFPAVDGLIVVMMFPLFRCAVFRRFRLA